MLQSMNKLKIPNQWELKDGNPNGEYELVSVITHQGRSADSGHYISWILDRKDRWYKLDDDKVKEVNTQEIYKLGDGGDWHTAYLMI